MGRSHAATQELHCGSLIVALTRIGRNRLLLELKGELDLASAEELERRLFLPRRTRIDLDLSQLAFVDVQGARLLDMVVRKRGGEAKVVACSAAAERALELTGLSSFVPRSAQ
jgi:anti-anti-sigma factor